MAASPKIPLLGLTFQELSAVVQQQKEPEYRARQLFEAIYSHRLPSLELISTLPRRFRSALQEQGMEVSPAQIQKSFPSVDGTIRYLVEMFDGESVETVWMPEGDGGEAADGSDPASNDPHIRWGNTIRSGHCAATDQQIECFAHAGSGLAPPHHLGNLAREGYFRSHGARSSQGSRRYRLGRR